MKRKPVGCNNDIGGYIRERILHWETAYKTVKAIKADPYHAVGMLKELEKLEKIYKIYEKGKANGNRSKHKSGNQG